MQRETPSGSTRGQQVAERNADLGVRGEEADGQGAALVKVMVAVGAR